MYLTKKFSNPKKLFNLQNFYLQKFSVQKNFITLWKFLTQLENFLGLNTFRGS